MILATKKHYIVPCTVPYLFVIHDNNLIICLCVFHSETEIKTASLKSDWGEASHRCNSEFSCLLTALSLNSSHVYRNQDQHLDNWAASFELVREWSSHCGYFNSCLAYSTAFGFLGSCRRQTTPSFPEFGLDRKLAGPRAHSWRV